MWNAVINNVGFRIVGINKLKNVCTFTSSSYDIIIAGGGIIGTSLACALSKNNMLSSKRILLLEESAEIKAFRSVQYSNRVYALNQGSVKFLKKIGAWETILSGRYKPVKQMQVWDARTGALITFNHDNFEGNVAYIIENDLVLEGVYKELQKSLNVEIRNMSRIISVDLPDHEYKNSRVCLENGEHLTCELLIGADGANSLVRKQMGVETFTTPYNQMGLVATLKLNDVGDNSVGWQRFTPIGTVALLPLSDSMSSLVWSTESKFAQKLKTMPSQEFVDILNESLFKEYEKDNAATNTLQIIDSLLAKNPIRERHYPPRIKEVIDKSRACFPLGFMHASSYISQGTALIGDAAHRIHPLAGQGVNLGFGDINYLTEILGQAAYAGFNLGDKLHLLKYEKNQLMRNIPIMIGVHSLQQMFSTNIRPVILFRGICLQVTQNLLPLKKIFMQRAMG